MKKIIALALCAVLLLGCISGLSESAAMQEGVYTIYNLTGENVTYISITDNVNGEEMKVEFREGGLKNGASVVLSKSLAPGEDGNHRFTLTFETESGYVGNFTTLSLEKAPVSLLAQDTASGATPIRFTEPQSHEKENLGIVSMRGAFSLECTLPEGFLVESLDSDEGSHHSVIYSEKEGKPSMYLSIVFNELFADVQRLNDLSDEDLAQIEETFGEDDNVDIAYTETSHGTKLMVVKETLDEVDYVDFYTVYMGYEIEFVLVKSLLGETPESLTEEEIQMAVNFLSDLNFIPAE